VGAKDSKDSFLRTTTVRQGRVSVHMAADEVEVDPTCSCAVCMEVLVDPVTLPCGHALDLGCVQRVVNASRGGAACCPTCREPIPTVLPSISVQLRDLVARMYPKQVRRLARRTLCMPTPRTTPAAYRSFALDCHPDVLVHCAASVLLMSELGCR
jgi:hypothetical protein